MQCRFDFVQNQTLLDRNYQVQADNHKVDVQGEKIPPLELQIGADVGGRGLVYRRMKVLEDGLCGFEFLVGTFSTSPQGKLVMIVRPAGSAEILRTIKLDIGKLLDNQWGRVEFKPIINSRGLNIDIELQGEVERGRLALYERMSGGWSRKAKVNLLLGRVIRRILPVRLFRQTQALNPLYEQSGG